MQNARPAWITSKEDVDTRHAQHEYVCRMSFTTADSLVIKSGRVWEVWVPAREKHVHVLIAVGTMENIRTTCRTAVYGLRTADRVTRS